VNTNTLIAWAFVAVLGVLGVVFAVRQVRLLRRLPGPGGDLSPEARGYLRGQAWRRLVLCGLMLVLAGLLAGAYGSGMVERMQAIGDAGERERLAGGKPELNADDRAFVGFSSAYWLAIVLLLLGVIVTALFDLWYIRRFEVRELRRIQDDRRAMIEHELAVYRSLRNGEGGRTE
jgi:hypothetical protein